VFGRKILRKIFGPTKEDNDNWRIETNIELDIIQRLSVFERKILRKIFGPTKEDNDNWRIETNIKLDIIQRLSVFESKILRKIFGPTKEDNDNWRIETNIQLDIIQRLSVFERKILRKIFGPTKEDNDNWRIKTNIELDKLIKHRNKINYAKAQRFSWFGYTNRLPETSIVQKIHKRKPFTGRPVGRPKSRWEDDVRNDLKKMKLIKWTE